jgi:DNA-binding transcriptional LysR family regulator
LDDHNQTESVITIDRNAHLTEGSLSAAARRLGVTLAVVSKRPLRRGG